MLRRIAALISALLICFAVPLNVSGANQYHADRARLQEKSAEHQKGVKFHQTMYNIMKYGGNILVVVIIGSAFVSSAIRSNRRKKQREQIKKTDKPDDLTKNEVVHQVERYFDLRDE